MSVHPSPRLPAIAGDAATAPAADAAGGGDLFNILVSGLVGAGTATTAANGDSEAAPTDVAEVTETPPADAKAVPESVEQLLALVGASRTHGAGKKTETTLKAEGEQEEPRSDGAAKAEAPAAPAIVPTTASAPAVPAAAPATLLKASLPASPAAPLAASAMALAKAQPKLAPIALAAAAAAPAASPLAALLMTAAVAAPATATSAEAEAAATADSPSAETPVPAQPAPAAAVQGQPASVALQQPAAAEPAQAAIKSLLAELTVPAGERRRPERALPSEAPVTAAAAPRQTELPAVGNAAPAPLAPAQPSDQAQAAAPAAPLQGLVIERQLDLAHQQDWIDQLARDITSAAGGDGGALRFRLNPEHLGTLHVEIAQSHHGAAVRFSADSEAARAIIADAQPRLVAEARAQGMRISEAHVDLGTGGQSGDSRRQTAAPGDVPIRTARSLQEEPASAAGDGKPTPRRRELYA